jgi:gamma-glutamyltranspeptidase/glutathione hydrolase
MVLDMLEDLGVPDLGHWSESASALYFLAHALRRARFETGYVNDPAHFGVPTSELMSREYHRSLAAIIEGSTPKSDLTPHYALTALTDVSAAGGTTYPPGGSCETSVVDRYGNWIQMMNTLQSGGIPGEVIDGVPMVGSHFQVDMSSWISGWLIPESRMRGPMGSTFVLRDGKPWLSLGTPGSLWATVVQVLSNLLDYGMTPEQAIDCPRILELTDTYRLPAESRFPKQVVDGLLAKGILVEPMEPYNWHLGSFQVSWRTPDGALHGATDPRREGKVAAL